MTFIVGESSLHHVLEKLSASFSNQGVDTSLALTGLSLNPNAANPRKIVQHYFESFSYHHWNIVIWYDVRKNSDSRNRSKYLKTFLNLKTTLNAIEENK